MKYSMNTDTKARILLIVVVAALIAAGAISYLVTGKAEDEGTCWILCKPGSQVNIRISPDKDAASCGFLECGDSFQTDGESRNGWIRVLDRGESAEAWVYAGYVVTEEPVGVFQNYVVTARKRVACRRWVNGPQVSTRPWLKNGTEVTVFYTAGEWAVTGLGYVQTEWLEVDPE